MSKHVKRLEHCLHLAALRSPDPSTKVGAKLYSSQDELLAMNYNSFPPTSKVGPEYYDVRELKYDRMIHAEMRCLLEAGLVRSRGGVLYTSMIPCKDCAKHIAEACLSRVYYPSSCLHSDFVRRQVESVHIGQLVLAESGVECIEVEGV